MDARNTPADQTIGANRPPLVTAEQLAKDFAHLENEVAEIEALLGKKTGDSWEGYIPNPDTPFEAEDDADAGRHDVHSLGVGATDAVIGISASGHTPYVLGAMEAAGAAGAATACVVNALGSPLALLVERAIVVVVGPELLAGSTRLKAGTAQKLVLNTISTISMIRLGKTFDNLMVDVVATNEKLRARVRRIVMTATGAPPEEADAALAAADGSAKVAIVTLLAGVDVETARSRLAAAGGNIRQALA